MKRNTYHSSLYISVINEEGGNYPHVIESMGVRHGNIGSGIEQEVKKIWDGIDPSS